MLKRQGLEVLRDEQCELSLQALEGGIRLAKHSERHQWLADIEAGRFRLQITMPVEWALDVRGSTRPKFVQNLSHPCVAIDELLNIQP